MICKQHLHLSAVSCPCSKRIACPIHAHLSCECPFGSRKLLYRHSISDLCAISRNLGKEYSGFIEDISAVSSFPPVVPSTSADAKVDDENTRLVSTKSRRTSSTNKRGSQSGSKRRREEISAVPIVDNSFSEVLASWKEHASTLVKQGGSKSTEITTLINSAQQFLWAGDAVHELRVLYEKLLAASQWVAACKKAAQNKVTWEVLEDLLSWRPPPVNLPILGRLRSIRKTAFEWKAQADETQNSTSPVDMSALEALVASGSKLHVLLPDLAVLQSRLQVGEEVRAALAALFSADPSSSSTFEAADLKRLQQKAGQARVSFPELVNLNSTIMEIDQLQDKARNCLELKSTLPKLIDLLHQLHSVPAYIPEIRPLQSLVELAEDWKMKTADCITRKDSLKKMREHLHAGERLSVELVEVLLEALFSMFKKQKPCSLHLFRCND